ncbi:MAG: hypothetical protein WCO84_01015 [bacterium]
MKVYFENSQGREREIGEGLNEQECYKIIYKFLDEFNYKSYYARSWKTDKGIKVDVGSHTEFFYIRKVDTNESLFI